MFVGSMFLTSRLQAAWYCACGLLIQNYLFSKVFIDAVHLLSFSSLAHPSHFYHIFIKSSTCPFLNFLLYFSHCPCLHNSFIPYSVQLCRFLSTSSFPPHPISYPALSSLLKFWPCKSLPLWSHYFILLVYFTLTLEWILRPH